MIPSPAAISPSHSPRRLWKILAVIFSLLLTLGNGWLSIIAIALAVPGNGPIGAGFKIIALTFIAGNLLLAGFGLFSARHPSPRLRILGLLFQFLTLPLCLTVSVAMMYLFDISDL